MSDLVAGGIAVTVRLESGVAPPGTPHDRTIALAAPVSLAELLGLLGETVPLIERLTGDAAAADRRPSLLILRNEGWIQPDEYLADGDVIEIHPPMAGG